MTDREEKIKAYKSLSEGIYLMTLEDDKLKRCDQAKVLLDMLSNIHDLESKEHLRIVNKLFRGIFGLKGEA